MKATKNKIHTPISVDKSKASEELYKLQTTEKLPYQKAVLPNDKWNLEEQKSI